MRKALGNQFYRGEQALPFREAVQIDKVVYFSGQLAFDADGRISGETIEAQTHACLDNIQNVLERCGLGLDDVFKVNAWLVNVDDFAGFNSVFARIFDGNLPVRSTVCSDLMAPGALVELEIMAYSDC